MVNQGVAKSLRKLKRVNEFARKAVTFLLFETYNIIIVMSYMLSIGQHVIRRNQVKLVAPKGSLFRSLSWKKRGTILFLVKRMETTPLSEFDGVILDGLDFCKGVYKLLENTRQMPNGSERLRRRTSNTERKLLGELLPICKYIHARYRAGRYISVRWIDGDQSFDAELHQRGGYIDRGYYPRMSYLEVTSAMHKNEHWMWEMLGSGCPVFAPEGITKSKRCGVVSKPVVFTNDEHVQNFAKIVLKQLEKKTKISYPTETSLIVQCSLNNLYLRDEWELLVREVRGRMPQHRFREILLYDGMCEYISIL